MRIKSLLAAVSMIALSAALPAAYLTTNSGGKVYVCATPQPADLDQTAYEALTWVEVKGIGNFGETGNNQNILTYDSWSDDVVQKAKGNTNAGDPEIEYRRIPADPGQVVVREAAAPDNRFQYAFKVERNDKETPTGTGTTTYNRGIVTGPKQPNGRSEDFMLEMVTLGLNQIQIIVEPT